MLAQFAEFWQSVLVRSIKNPMKSIIKSRVYKLSRNADSIDLRVYLWDNVPLESLAAIVASEFNCETSTLSVSAPTLCHNRNGAYVSVHLSSKIGILADMQAYCAGYCLSLKSFGWKKSKEN